MSKPVKVIHVVPQLKIGGVENGALYLASKPFTSAIEYHLICLEDNTLNSALIASYDNVHVLNGQRFSPFSYFRAFQYVRRLKPNWVLCSLWRSQPLLWLLRIFCKCKVAIVMHNSAFKHTADKFASVLSMKMAHQRLCDSRASQALVKQFTAKSTELVPHYLPAIRVKKSKRPFSLVYVGRITPSKGLLSALCLLKVLREKEPRWHFDLYGPDEDHLDTLQSKAHSMELNDALTYKGELSPLAVSEHLAMYSYFLMPSEKEGTAMAVREAMQQGVIPIVNPVGDIVYYTQDGQSALWFGQYHINELATRLNSLERNHEEKTRMLTAIEQQMKQQLHYDDYIANWLKLEQSNNGNSTKTQSA